MLLCKYKLIVLSGLYAIAKSYLRYVCHYSEHIITARSKYITNSSEYKSNSGRVIKPIIPYPTMLYTITTKPSSPTHALYYRCTPFYNNKPYPDTLHHQSVPNNTTHTSTKCNPEFYNYSKTPSKL